MDLAHKPPGDPGRPDSFEDPFAAIAASRRRLQERTVRAFPMPHDRLFMWCRKPGWEQYRNATEPDKPEWERWAQVLIDSCAGFQRLPPGEEIDVHDLDESRLLTDDMGVPVLWDTLAALIGVDLDPEEGVRGLVRDVFPAELDMVDHAQRVDAWINTATTDEDRAIAKGS